MFCPAWYPVWWPQSTQPLYKPMISFLCFELLRPALLLLSPFLPSLLKLLFSYSVPLGSNVWACRSPQCAFSASVQGMKGRALKHSPSPHRVPCTAEPGKEGGGWSRRGVVTCMCYHLTPSFAEDTPWVTSHYWLQQYIYAQVWQDSNRPHNSFIQLPLF